MELTVVDGTAGVSHVRLEGRMDPHGTTKVRDRLRAETVESGRAVIVDMSSVTFITSVGIGLIVDCAHSVLRAGHAFVLVSPTGHVDDVLRKTSVYDIIQSAKDVESAIILCKRPPA